MNLLEDRIRGGNYMDPFHWDRGRGGRKETKSFYCRTGSAFWLQAWPKTQKRKKEKISGATGGFGSHKTTFPVVRIQSFLRIYTLKLEREKA